MTTDLILRPSNFAELADFARLAANSDLVPRDYRGKAGNIMIACQMGSELGLSPMQSLSSIAVINGRPGVWGDGLIGLCRASPLCEDITETLTGEGDDRVAVCIAKRKGAAPVEGRFSVADAKRAGLWGKDIWAKYPDRMLQNRARGFALRDAFPDVLRGLQAGEELMDTPPDKPQGATIDADRTPLQLPPTEPQYLFRPEHRPEPSSTSPPPTPLHQAKQNHEASRTPLGTPDHVEEQKPQTIAQFLDSLDRELLHAPDSFALVALLQGPRIEQAKKHLKGEARQRLAYWIGRAEGRLAELRAAEQAQAKADDAAEAAIEEPKAPDTPTAPTLGPDGMPENIDEWPMVGEDKLLAG